MNYFIKNIHINKLFHLNGIDIPIADEKCPHLIITGKNGSGKTVLLNAISDFLNIIKNDKSAEDENLYGRVDVQSDLLGGIIEKYNKGEFVIAFYQADRKVKMSEPKNPTKPVYNKKGDVKETATSQFLNFLSDLKIQEALARNEKQTKDADEISAWFEDFESLMRHI